MLPNPKARDSDNADRRRTHQLPLVNFDAESYADMISWNTEYKSEPAGDDEVEFETHITGYTDPPILSGYSIEEIKSMAENQKVERTIKLVTETSKMSGVRAEREGIIRIVISSREKLPKFESKRQLKMEWRFTGEFSKK